MIIGKGKSDCCLDCRCDCFGIGGSVRANGDATRTGRTCWFEPGEAG